MKHDLSMVGLPGLCSTLAASKYVVENDIPGDFVECGVWRGGNSLIAAEVFRRNNSGKKVYLFDTFKGMTKPTEADQMLDGTPALQQFRESETISHNSWCYSSLEEVQSNFSSRGLLENQSIFVEGPVEETLTDIRNLPEQISVLRLDTDWYESTRIELEILYPRLSKGGCIIIDDYGFWKGSRKATDEYFATLETKPMLHVTDRDRRIGIKI
jgi:O-methyltransferase